MSLNIYANNITKKVKKKTIFENLKLNIQNQSFIALVGPSGSGKTTLLNILSGYDTHFEGELFYNQWNIKKEDLRSIIAYVPQQEILHKDLTLWKELWYIAKIRFSHMQKEMIQEKINKVIYDLDLKGQEDTLIKHLSGGEKKDYPLL